jgi:D-3-phosphoglycerate dehydrogenase
MKINITTSSFGKFHPGPLELLKQNKIEYKVNPFGRKLTQKEVIELAQGAVGLIAGTEILDQDVLEKLPDLKVISRCGAGLDNIDMKIANALNIKVLSTPYGPTLAVAELTVGLILNLLRKIRLMDQELRSGTWKKRLGNLLQNKKIGIVGFGRIGKKVAELLSPFDTEIAYYDVQQKETAISYKKMDDLLEWADIISLHCSGSANSQPLIGESELLKISKGSWLINLSRGGLVDEEALFQAIERGQLSGAALDVFTDEPYAGKLRELPNVILTPHIGSYAKEGRIQMEMDSVYNLIEGLKD